MTLLRSKVSQCCHIYALSSEGSETHPLVIVNIYNNFIFIILFKSPSALQNNIETFITE